MIRNCLNPPCPNNFDVDQALRGRPKVYCSPECRYEHRYRRDNPTSFNVLVKPCKQCDKPFERIRSDQIFCCTECKTEWHNVNKKKKAKAVAQDKKYIERCCNYCGTDYHAARRSSSFCGSSCRTLFYRSYRMEQYVTHNQLFDSRDFMPEDMIGNIYIDCNFDTCDFSSRLMTKARFIRCTFTDCDFRKTMFDGVDLIDVEFEGVNIFDSAIVNLTRFPQSTCLEMTKVMPKLYNRTQLKEMFKEALRAKAERYAN